MCKNCYSTTAASFSPSLAIAMTNPELVWSHHQEQKQRAGLYHTSQSQPQAQAQAQQQPGIKPSSASTYSESTTYSYDKDKSHSETNTKRSMKQRIKDTFKDMGSPPTSKYDRDHGQETKNRKSDHGPMGSSPLGRT
ncbi:hypothetical protein F4819DRAFT_471755 [Hypoxylon fuscum]|nr:hypothetical protein F4819DRAFT_471755 [Hypoxylon fuscum]